MRPLFQGSSARKKELSTGQIFWENEINANLLAGKFMLVLAAVLGVCWLLNALGVLEISQKYVLEIFPVGIVLLLIPAVVCLSLKGEKKWIKYLVMLSQITTLAYLDSILTFNVPLLIVIPIAFSCWYYSGVFTLQISLISAVFFAVSAFFGAYFNTDTPDQNFAAATQADYIRDVMLLSFLPRLMVFAVIAAICYVITDRGRRLIVLQDEISQKNSRIEAELSLATRIQAEMLPTTFPAFPDRDEFDIFATMSPAKEVGGDFYDFFMVDDHHIAIVMADVSGKGVPAALFMAIAKAMIKDHTESEKHLGNTFTKVNNLLCEYNGGRMFVTAFEGVLDLVTGEFIFVNAGHEIPYICRNGKTFELYTLCPEFVLAGMEDTSYQTESIIFEPGDKLFQYTDGITEATNADEELYGQERLTAVLGKYASKSPAELLPLIRADIDAFVGSAPQFDDITMLCFEYKKKMKA